MFAWRSGYGRWGTLPDGLVGPVRCLTQLDRIGVAQDIHHNPQAARWWVRPVRPAKPALVRACCAVSSVTNINDVDDGQVAFDLLIGTSSRCPPIHRLGRYSILAAICIV